MRHPTCCSSLEKTRAAARGGCVGGHDEVRRGKHLAGEVARVELLAPDRLVDPAQLGDRELPWAESPSERRVLELGPGPLDAVAQDLAVIEREVLAGEASNRNPRSRRRVGAGGK